MYAHTTQIPVGGSSTELMSVEFGNTHTYKYTNIQIFTHTHIHTYNYTHTYKSHIQIYTHI